MSTAASQQPPPRSGLDTSSPNIARVYDYWLGGKENFAADRHEAERLIAMYPPLPEHVRGNRLFLARAVTWLAEQGIRQFLDIGSGLPTAQNTHQVARAIDPSCRVVYVDSDPVVVTHASALLAGTGVESVEADIADPADLLGRPAVRRLIRPEEPTGLILAMVLHFFDPQQAARITAALTGWLAPGSYAVISVGSGDEETAGAIAREYRPGSLRSYSRDQMGALFAGLELVPPGLTDARLWMPGESEGKPSRPSSAYILAGVGRKLDSGCASCEAGGEGADMPLLRHGHRRRCLPAAGGVVADHRAGREGTGAADGRRPPAAR